MMNWKLTKKLKDFGSRSKSPAPSEISKEGSPDSGVPKINVSSSDVNSSHSPSSSIPPSKSSTSILDTPSRKTTLIPTQSTGELQQPAASSSSASQTSNRTVGSSLTTNSQQDGFAQSENINPFKPGLLTIKMYNGRGFQIPFDLNFEKSLITKLINSSSDPRSKEDDLIKQLNSLSLQQDEIVKGSELGAILPANITIPSQQSILKNSLIYFTLEFDKTIVSVDAEAGTIANPNFGQISQFDVTKLANELKFQVFLKLPSSLTKDSTSSEPSQSQNQDILISSKTISLRFDNISTPIRLKNHDAIKLDNEFSDLKDAYNGELIISIDFKPNENKHLTIDDFDLLKVIGKGSFGKVMQVRKNDSGKIYALKAIRKSHVVSKREVTHTLAERTVLATVNNPFIVPLKFSFQSKEKLYLVLNFINGGELFYHLQKSGRFDLARSRFYTCELLSALDCLHSMDVIYRDLKPENILLDYKGHIALCDFGLCKLNMKNDDQTTTFCGTPEYLAPELLLGEGYTKSVDWWTLGVLLYEMLTGLPPYYDEVTNVMYQKILKDPLRFPDNFDKDAKDLLIKLLSRDPSKRLGSNGAWEIQQHPFFKLIDWQRLNNKQYLPPFKPPVKDSFDTSNFDKEFTSELPVDSVVNDYLSDSVQKQFGGWTYVGTEHLGESRG